MSRAVDLANSVANGVSLGFKNRIINGAMRIDQRNAGASVTPANGAYVLDRWKCYLSQASKYSVQRSTTSTAGFINSMIATSLSAYTVGSSEYFLLSQPIEGLNVTDLGWGTANAQTVTLSFWVRSSLTGTFGGAFGNSAGTRSYPFSYTISAANTWEYKTITVVGDTTGTWLTDTGTGIIIYWSLGSGASVSTTAGSWASGFYSSATGTVSVIGTNGATFYITGVQLEKGSTATSFDYRPIGTELMLCQRYLPSIPTGGNGSVFGTGMCYSASAAYCYIPFQVTPRVAPNGITVGNAGGFALTQSSSAQVSATNIAFNDSTLAGCGVLVTGASGLTAGHSTLLKFNATAGGLIYFNGCEL